MPKPLAARLEKIKVQIEEVNTTTHPPVAHVREVTTGGAMIVNLTGGPSGTWVTPNVGEMWWIQFLGTRWVLHSRLDGERGATDTPGTSNYVKLSFEVSEQETELIYKGVIQFNSAAVNKDTTDISHYIINWIACDENGAIGTAKANQYTWYPNKASDGSDAAVDPNTGDAFDYIAILPKAIENPKTTFYKARLRAVSKSGVMGDWTDWTSPSLPVREAYNLPPNVQDVTLDFTVAESDDKTLLYNAIVRFKDVGYWDLPEGDFADDIDRYEIQVQPFEVNNPTLATLSSSITSTSATTFTATLENGVTAADIENTFVLIDKEAMLVTDITSGTWTVARAQQFTTAAKHSGRKAIKVFISDSEVEVENLIPSPKDELGTLDAPKSVEDADEEETWPLLGVLDVADEDATTEDFLGASETSFDIVVSNPDFLAFITSSNMNYGVNIQIDSEIMEVKDIVKVANTNYTYTFTVERGQEDSEKSDHVDASKVYLQSWIPIFNLVNSVQPEDNVIAVAMFQSWNLPADFSIKIDNEVMRVTKKTYTGTDTLGRRTYELSVYRGIQNTAAQSHAATVGYYSIGNYYTHIFTAIPNPAKYWWRARVRAVDRFNRKGLWSDWTDAIKASLAASALPSPPSEIALNFVRNHRGREWSNSVEVSYNSVQYEIEGGDTISDVAGYQVRLFHSDGAYLYESIDDSSETTIKVVEPARSGNLQRQLSGVGTGYIVLTSDLGDEDNPASFYEIMYVTGSQLHSSGAYWEYTVQRGVLNSTPRSFTYDSGNPTYVFYFPPQTATTNVSKTDAPLDIAGESRYTTKFDLVRRQWWYVAQVRTVDSYNRLSPWSVPSNPGSASDTTRPPAPFNINVFPYANNTVKIDWDAPIEPGVNIPADLLELLSNAADANGINSSDFDMLSTDISFFKVQLWSEDPHQEIPLNAKAFGINSISKSGSTITFNVDVQQNIEVDVTSKAVATVGDNSVATLTTAFSNHGIVAGQTITVAGVDVDLNGTFEVLSVGTRTITYQLDSPISDVDQTSCTGTITFDEEFSNWFDAGQSINIENCSPEELNGQKTLATVATDSFTITLTTAETVFTPEDEALVRPFDAIQSTDYFATYPIHYFVRSTRSSNVADNLSTCITAGEGDICFVSETDAQNTGYWRLKNNIPRDLNSWVKIPDADFNVQGLVFFDQYVSTTSRTISSETLPDKVWARVCSVDDSGNSSAWVASGPFFTTDVYKPQNVILDFDDPESPEFDGGTPSSTSSFTVDNGLYNTANFDAVIDANLNMVTIEGYNPEIQGLVLGATIQWDEVSDSDSSLHHYDVELQSGRMFAQLWENSLHYWANTTSKDVIYGGLADSIDNNTTILSAVQLSSVPAPEFYVKIDSEIIYVTNIILDWNDEQQTFINANYEIERGALGTTAVAHDAGAIIYSVHTEPIKVLELDTPESAVPFDITIGNERMTVFSRTAVEDADYSNIYYYEVLRDRKNGNSTSDFEHDGINYRIPIFDSLGTQTQTALASADTDADDIVTVNFDILYNELRYRARTRSVFNTTETGAWSDWTFWADPRDFVKPMAPTISGGFNYDATSLDLSWTDGYLNHNPYEATIFDNIASTSLMTQLNARVGDIAVLSQGAELKAYTLLFTDATDLLNWEQTLVPLTAIGTSDERVIPEGPDRIGGSVQETDYYEVQVSRVPKEGKSVNEEGSIGSLLETLPDGTDSASIIIAPLKAFTKFPKVGDKLQILGQDPITISPIIKGTSSKYEVQSIKLASLPSITGNWKAKFGASAYTSDLAYNATAGQVRLALAALGTLPEITATVSASTDIFTTTVNHGLVDGDIISFNSKTGATGLSLNTNYYVVSSTSKTFKISTTYGGSAVNITLNGTNVKFSAVVVSKPNTSFNEWRIRFLTLGEKSLIEVASSTLDIGFVSEPEVVTITDAATEAEWATSKVTLQVQRNEGGTFVHPAGSVVKWVDITGGDFENNAVTSFEYLYLWKVDPLYLDTSISYPVDSIGDYLYAARVRARDAAGNSSAWSEFVVEPYGLPVPEVTNLAFTELGDSSEQINAKLTFQSDISPEYNITHFVPELMPSLQTRLLNDITTTSTDVVISVSATVPSPNNPDDLTEPGIGPYYAFIEDEIVLVTSRTEIASWPKLTGKAWKLTITRAQLSTTADAHRNGCQFEWFYHPTAKQTQYGISYSGAISTAPVEPSSGVLIEDYIAEFVGNFDGVIQAGRWYQGRAKSMSGTISSSWSNWSLPLRAHHEMSANPRDPVTPTTPPKPNPVRNLIIDVDSKRVNVSWLAPRPNKTTDVTTHVNSVDVSAIVSDSGNSVALTDAEWAALEIDKSTVDFAKVTTSTSHNFYGYNTTVSGVKVPADEVAIAGAYAPFNGSFPVLAVLSSTSFIIPVEFDTDTDAPTSYPASGADSTAVASISDPEVSNGSEIDHYIVSIKRAKTASSPTLSQLRSGAVKWAPALMKDPNVKATHKRFKLRRPAGDLPYFAKVVAVNAAGKKSEPRYAKGDVNRPPQPRIESLTIHAGRQGRRYFAKLKIDKSAIISDVDIDRYKIQWCVSADANRDPAGVDTYFHKTITRAAVKDDKKAKLGHLQPKKYLFVRVAAHDRDGNLSQWTRWRRKKIVSG